MGLDLVPRSARAFSDHLNKYYRVLKGVDQDSVAVRLPSGGSFEVRHSATNAPVLKITDAGFEGAIGPEDLSAGGTPNRVMATANGTAAAWQQVTGPMIATATITSDKLQGGIPVPANSITTNEIANGTIATVDLAAGAAGLLTSVGLGAQTIPGTSGFLGLTGSTIGPITVTGKPILFLLHLTGYGSAAAISANNVGVYMDGSSYIGFSNEWQAANVFISRTFMGVAAPSAGSHTFVAVWSNTGGTVATQISGGYFTLWETRAQ